MHLPLQEMTTGAAAEQWSALEHGVRLCTEKVTWAPGENTFHTGYILVKQVRFLLKEVKFHTK